MHSKTSRNFGISVIFVLAMAGLTACTTDTTSKTGVTIDPEALRKTTVSDDNILRTTGNASQVASEWRVNGFLWRAAIDTFAFMPVRTIDPVSGNLQTEWYSSPSQPNVRHRVGVQISSAALIADSLRVSAFSEFRAKSGGSWLKRPQNSALVRKLEDSVLERARTLRSIALDLE